MFEDLEQIPESPQVDSSEKTTTNNPDDSTITTIQNLCFVCSKPALNMFPVEDRCAHLVGHSSTEQSSKKTTLCLLARKHKYAKWTRKQSDAVNIVDFRTA